jgi:Bacterial Ig-like domain/Galactose oxidase, central domain
MNKTTIQAFLRQTIQSFNLRNRIVFAVLVSLGLLLGGLAVAFDSGSQIVDPYVQNGQQSTLKLTGDFQQQNQGASTTLLPSGQWLLLGGKPANNSPVVRDAKFYDPKTGKTTTRAYGLVEARFNHTATLLPDGRVLVLGGINGAGKVLNSAEYFNPSTAESVIVKLKLIPRAQHRATLLADGNVLVSGGINASSQVLADMLLIDPTKGIVTPMPVKLDLARHSHVSTLLPHHDVLLSGGIGADGLPLEQSELYQPGEPYYRAYGTDMTLKLLGELNNPELPVLLDSDPGNAAQEVPIDKIMSLRFSKPLKVASVNSETVVLMGPNGAVPSTLTPTEGGLVVFVDPKQDLLPGSDYALIVQGPVDQLDQPINFAALGFKTGVLNIGTDTSSNIGNANTTTDNSATSIRKEGNETIGTTAAQATADTSNQAPTIVRLATGSSAKAKALVNDDEAWVPTEKNRHGNWQTSRALPQSTFDLLDNDERVRHKIKAMRARLPESKQRKSLSAPKLSAANSTTGVAGTVLRLNDKPLANATLTIGAQTTKTDKQGHFELTGIAPGHYEMMVDGSTANYRNHDYLTFSLGVDVHNNGMTELSHYLYVPRIQADDWVDLPSPTSAATVVTHPAMPGLELRIPKGTVFRDKDGKVVTRIAIVPIPLDRPPYPTPDAFPSYFMLHPGGVVVQGISTEAAQGIQIVYPNNSQNAPGTQDHLWVYDPNGDGWLVYGHATVSADGTVHPAVRHRHSRQRHHAQKIEAIR